MLPAFNLLILHTVPDQALADWLTVKRKIESRAPDIEVRIASNLESDEAVRAWQITRPSLVFSPIHLVTYKPPGGKVYVGRNFVDKLRETEHLIAAGLPVPESRLLTRGLVLNPATWGEYSVIKPNIGSSKGANVRLVRTTSIRLRYLELTLNDRSPMIVQKFIDSTDEENRLCSYRVLTMFGRPLYARRWRWRRSRRPLAAIADDPIGGIAIQHWQEKRDAELIDDPDMLALASRVAVGIPDVPCLGVDIIRERATGALHVLEVNPGGNTWHFSSAFGMDETREHRQALYRQFGALEIAADALVAKTRTEAV